MKAFFNTLRKGRAGEIEVTDSGDDGEGDRPASRRSCPIDLVSVEVKKRVREELVTAAHNRSGENLLTSAQGVEMFASLEEWNWKQIAGALDDLGLLDKRFFRPPLPPKGSDRLKEGMVPAAAELCFASLVSCRQTAHLKRLWAALQAGHTADECVAVPHPFFTDVCIGLGEQLNTVFDQYSGVRQVGDMRGIPEQGPLLHQAGLAWVSKLNDRLLAVLVFVFGQLHDQLVRAACASEKRPDVAVQAAANIRAVDERLSKLLNDILADYRRATAAMVNGLGFQSSRVMTMPSGKTFNDHFKDLFVQDTIRASASFETELRDRLDAAIRRLDQEVGATKRAAVYERAGGRQNAIDTVHQACDALRPWTVNWLAIQQQSFAVRDVYGSPETVRRQLDESRLAALEGLKACLESFVADPLLPLPDLFDILSE